MNQTTICQPNCGHEAYDAECSDYDLQPCCEYIVHVDDIGSTQEFNHLPDCKEHGSDYK